MQTIDSCLWFDHQAEEASKFYTKVFKNSKIKRVSYYPESAEKVSGQRAGSIMTVDFALENVNLVALNGGPHFKFTPSFSLFVRSEDEREVSELWKKLSEGGEVRMGLDKYPWADMYGWTKDKFGLEWQLMKTPSTQKIAPAFLFVDALFGKGQAAVDFYTGIFPNSKVQTMARDEGTQTISHCAFTLNNQEFVLMEGQGKHGHTFTHAFSLSVNCDTQAEIDSLWTKLSEGGATEQCGWLRDKFGVSWQIVPKVLADLASDPKKSDKVMAAMLKMTKLDLAALQAAAR